MRGNESTKVAGGHAARVVLRLARLGAVVLVVCGMLGVLAATAGAVPAHKFVDRFTPPGTSPNSALSSLAFQQSSDEFYVLDSANNRVLHLSGTGTLIGQFGPGGSPDAASATYQAIASDDDNDEVLLLDGANFGDRPSGAIDRFDADGTYLSQIDESSVPSGKFYPSGVVVNPSNGNVYVSDYGSCITGDPLDVPSVYVFNSAGVLQSQITGDVGTEGELNCPLGVGVDTAGNVYVREANFGTIKRFTAAGVFDSTVYGDGLVQALAVDPASGALYVSEGNRVVQFSGAGTRQSAWGSDQLSSTGALALNTATDRVFALDANTIASFDPAIFPTAATDPATALAPDGATLNGTVDPLGLDTTFHFEWGLDTSYGTPTDETPVAGAGPVSAPLTGLTPNTAYHYRVVATNADGSTAGDDQTFTTLTTPPTVGGESSGSIHAFSAVLNATVNPQNAPTTYHFEYGTDTSYGTSVPVDPADAGADIGDHPFSASLTGLDPSTVYHWRIVADNSVDPPTLGADQTFTTSPPPPAATIGAVTGITTTSATFHASVDTKGLAGTYHFTVTAGNSAYTETTAPVDIDAPASPGLQEISASLADLPSGSPLHVRATIVTAGGSASTETADFTTPAIPFTPLPPPLPDLAPYGCTTPHLNAYTAKAKAGKTITLTGTDLGIGGVVSFGSSEVDTSSWGATAVKAQVPSGAKGTVAVKLDCSHVSNTISVKIAKAKAKPVKCKKGYVKKKVKGKTRCVKKKAKHHRR